MWIFIRKLLIVLILFIVVNAIILFAIPRDNNSYYKAYLDKIELCEKLSSPRVIFIGGSNLAFGIDAKRIKDSLCCNVINMGLHAGIGIVYPVEDCLQFVRKGDVVVLQFENSNYYNKSSFGNSEVFPNLIYNANWRNIDKLHIDHYKRLVGLPKVSMSNLIRLFKYILTGSFDTKSQPPKFKYTRGGFNELGDEVSHLKYPDKFVNILHNRTSKISIRFIEWLNRIIREYEKKGVKVIMIPPICTFSYFENDYNPEINSYLESMHHSYVVSPVVMTVDDSCMFNSPHHLNREGICQSTSKIIKILKSVNCFPIY